MFEHVEINCYVVYEGRIPELVRAALEAWLGRRHGRRLTEAIWVYRSNLSAAEARARTLEIRDLLEVMSDDQGTDPWRVLFLDPTGGGSIGYRLPSVSWSGEGDIGAEAR